MQWPTFQTWITFTLSKGVCSSKTWVLSYQNTRRQNPQDQKYESPPPWKPTRLSIFMLSSPVVKIRTVPACWKGVGGGAIGEGGGVDNSHGYSAILRHPGQEIDETETSVIRHYTVRGDTGQMRHGASETAPCSYRREHLVFAVFWSLHLNLLRFWFPRTHQTTIISILRSVDRASVYYLVNETNLVHKFILSVFCQF
jgi:hypothetical protein